MYNTSMKKSFLIFILLLFIVSPVSAASINAAAYKTMQARSYRDNYNRQTGVTPYWKLQSNYATRNRMYNSYSNYNNSVNQFNYNTRMYRGRY